MPIDVDERVRATPNSGVELGRKYRMTLWVAPSGFAPSRRPRRNRCSMFLAAPVQSPTGSPIGRQIEKYVRRYVTENLELASILAKPAGVSSSPLARAATMSPWEAKNRRRIRLINKKYGEGLSARETDELARLKREVAAHVESVAPRTGDVLDEQAVRLARLKLKKAQAKKGTIG